VIHAGSFSKSIFPGLRLGWLVGPDAFIREARALRTTVLRHPPRQLQRTVAYFLSLGHYDALVNRMKQTYRQRRQVMEAAIRDCGLVVAQRGGFGGSSFWMRAPEGVPTGALALRLRPRGVLIEPGAAFFAPQGAPESYFRLAYSSIAESRIAAGIGLIADEIARG
jgi:GntR family transcriptional regulator / MocR family aminotransferase